MSLGVLWVAVLFQVHIYCNMIDLFSVLPLIVSVSGRYLLLCFGFFVHNSLNFNSYFGYVYNYIIVHIFTIDISSILDYNVDVVQMWTAENLIERNMKK